MEITKEQFINTFKSECSKAADNANVNAFIDDNNNDVVLDIGGNISFLLMALSKNNNAILSYVGTIMLEGIVEYKSFELTKEECGDLVNFYKDSESIAILNFKKSAILLAESVLKTILV
jgi:hypothetical protein